MSALDSVPMDSIIFYKPPLAVVPDVNPLCSLPTIPHDNNGGPALLQDSKLCESWKDSRSRDHENSIVTRDYHDGSSDDGDLPSLNELLSFAKQECIITLGNKAEKTVNHTPDGNPASYNEPIVLNDDDEESESTQSKADDGDHDVDCTGEFDGASSRDPTSELVDDDFDLRTLLSDFTTTDDSDADDHNGNNGVTTDECPVPTEQQRAALSCCDSILHCDGSDKSGDDYIFDVFATDEDEDGEDARPTKRRKLSAFSCRNPSPKIIITELQDSNSDQTQSPPAAPVAVPQPDLRSVPLLEQSHREGIAENDGDSSLRLPINIEFSNTASTASAALQSTDLGDPQPDDLVMDVNREWEIRNIIGTKKVDGVMHYWVDWEPTWMPESELGGAREMMDKFVARLQVRLGDKNEKGEADVIGDTQQKKRRGRPRKRL